MRNVVSAMFVASLLAVGVAAQGQQPATPGQPAAQVEKPAAANVAKVTISGCIQNAPPAAAQAAGAPAAAAKFELANAKVVSGGPVGTSGAAAAVRYRLEGDEKTISTHLTQQVELTGMVAPAAATGATAPPVLKVESVKMISAKCS